MAFILYGRFVWIIAHLFVSLALNKCRRYSHSKNLKLNLDFYSFIRIFDPDYCKSLMHLEVNHL